MTTTVLESLVGEGKKFSDAEALAKGKLAADEHIANLNAQLEALKAQAASGSLVSAEAVDKILAEIKQSRQTPDTKPDASSKGTDNQSTGTLTEDQIVALMNKRDLQRQQQQAREQTLEQVAKVYGSKTDEFLTKLASDTGFTLDQLKSMAGTQPQAFLRIANLGQGRTSSTSQVSAVNSQAVTSSNLSGEVRNKAWYEAKMKEMGAKKFTFDKDLQSQMHRDMLGPNWE